MAGAQPEGGGGQYDGNRIAASEQRDLVIRGLIQMVD